MNGVVVLAGQRRLLVVTTDMQCCGNDPGSWQEDRRRVEAGEIRRRIRQVLERTSVDGLIVGGDFNLVSTPLPLVIVSGPYRLPHAGLLVAELRHLDGSDTWTWDGRGTPFPSRPMDFVLYSPHALALRQGYVLDTADLPQSELERLGLQPESARSTVGAPAAGGRVRLALRVHMDPRWPWLGLVGRLRQQCTSSSASHGKAERAMPCFSDEERLAIGAVHREWVDARVEGRQRRPSCNCARLNPVWLPPDHGPLCGRAAIVRWLAAQPRRGSGAPSTSIVCAMRRTRLVRLESGNLPHNAWAVQPRRAPPVIAGAHGWLLQRDRRGHVAGRRGDMDYGAA